MSKTKQKGWRITQELDQLIQSSKPPGMSESAYVTKVLHEALTQPRAGGGVPDGAAMEVLARQLAVKDEQIAALGKALEAAQETAKAAQALHAADRREDLALEGSGQRRGSESRWQRLRDAWRG